MVYDSHVHTTNSDGKNTLDEMCRYATGKGFRGVTITDHADMNFYESRDTYNRIERCIGEVRRAQKDYEGKLDVLCGVELGEYLYDPESAEALAEIRFNCRTFCMFNELIKTHWSHHNVLIGTVMDHGCHAYAEGLGEHSDDTPEDRNIVHHYRVYPRE